MPEVGVGEETLTVAIKGHKVIQGYDRIVFYLNYDAAYKTVWYVKTPRTAH